jgi:nucleoside-diphosphate-sugar epimerase
MPLPAARLRRPRLLIVGCGDVGLRVLRLLHPRWRVVALTSTPARAPLLRAAGARVIVGDLDRPASLARLAGLADAVLHLAPPPADGVHDARTAALLAALARRSTPARLVYASTTGVYGDAGGARFDETRPIAPATARARRRADAEARLRLHGRRGTGTRVSILRVPGIYAPDRHGGDPRERVVRALPVPAPDDDAYTNRIHADDLARACVAALVRGAPQRVYHASDDSELTIAAWHDLIADAIGAARPPRISRAQAREQLTAQQLSFWGESRRLDNRRLKRELRVVLRYPTPAAVAWR